MSSLRILTGSARAWQAEHSVALRASSGAAVCVAIAACASQGELPGWYGALAATLVCTGGVLSYRRRTRPVPYLKLLLGATMLGAFLWFFVTVSADAASGRLGAVEAPLAVLFTAMQTAHAFDMPSRRDLGFSLAGSATLMAVAGAHAADLDFAVYVALWAVLALTGLHASWASMAGGTPPRLSGVLASTAAALLVGALLVVFFPATRPSSLSGAGPAGTAGASTDAQPARLVPARGGAPERPASASGPTGVGGYLGFAGPLDTALRPRLGTEVVLRVRAQRPTYWLAETFDSWSGRSWSETGPARATSRLPQGRSTRDERWRVLAGGPPYLVVPDARSDRQPARQPGPGGTGPQVPGASPGAQADYQTFSLAAPASNLVLHAEQAIAVWIPTRRLYVGEGGTIRTGVTLGAGSVYSVMSAVATPSDAALEKANGTSGLTPAVAREDLQLPHPYPRVAALARRVTAHDSTVISKIRALEGWIGSHTKYSLDVPPLASGQDAVVQFLFHTRRGFCEQISTSLAVMLRSLGIPAREAVGYVPGHFDPLTGLYDEQAKDAHAWVQVWFPGYGWQSFDPTAQVPLANPSPASTIGQDLLAALGRVLPVPAVPVAAALALGTLALVLRHRRRREWSAKVTRELERAARRLAIRPEPGATLGSIATALDETLATRPRPDRASAFSSTGPRPSEEQRPSARHLADVAAAAAWGDGDAGRAAGRAYVQEARRIRRAARLHARRDARGGAHGRAARLALSPPRPAAPSPRRSSHL
ncbi:MAG: transglutaminaseTgpA domain-containing protein [Actinomycetota bacterium]|nr:transglutaminaseTgpA domain-containing protein [Actinomycetota bacterium]